VSVTQARCRACRQPVEWVTTANAKDLILDADPTPDGNVLVDEAGVGHVLGPLDLAMVDDRSALRMPHWATCPHADRFRKAKR
jgi:hypothetical protein